RARSASYPRRVPFHPSVRYPEYHGPVDSTEDNAVYEAVRESMRLLGLDAPHAGSPDWNPLGDIIRPGNRVMLKPNFLAEGYGIRRAEWEQVITHGSLVRAVLDYVLLALDGHGAVSVADGPQYDSDWDLILARTGTREVVEYCRSVGSVPIELIDLREYKQEVRGDVIQHRVQLPSDPPG